MSRRAVFLLCLVFTVAASVNLMEDDGQSGELSASCVRCICEVLGCPDQMTCGINNVCGPFRISPAYWAAAANKNSTDLDEFQQCTLNAHCATQTFLQYMRRYLPKCTKDSGRPVCETALSLHMAGHQNCTRTMEVPLASALTECLHRRVRAWLDHGVQRIGDKRTGPRKKNRV